MGSE
jgi:hypothetical protein